MKTACEVLKLRHFLGDKSARIGYIRIAQFSDSAWVNYVANFGEGAKHKCSRGDDSLQPKIDSIELLDTLSFSLLQGMGAGRLSPKQGLSPPPQGLRAFLLGN